MESKSSVLFSKGNKKKVSQTKILIMCMNLAFDHIRNKNMEEKERKNLHSKEKWKKEKMKQRYELK